MKGPEPSWDFYRSFLAVLEHGSLSGAARALGLTQPTIGRHIEALERAVGFPLFTRSRLGLIPTDAALELRPHAQALRANAASLLRTATNQGEAVGGSIRVTASEVIGAEILPPILTDLRERYPRLVIELVLSNQVDDLLSREADIAVRMVAPEQDALLARHLGPVELGLHGHRHYLERHGKPERLDDLAGHALIGFDRETAAIRSMLKRAPAFGRFGFALRTDSDLAQLSAVRCGYGIGGVQVRLAARDPNLVRVLPQDFSLMLDTWLVMHENLRANRSCRAVFDALATGLEAYIAG